MPDDINALARNAMQAMEAVVNACGDLPLQRTRRAVVSSTLLRASVDYGRAVALLISTEPREYGAAATALLRSQLDMLLRGVFFGANATDQEVEYFLANDEMPSRVRDPANGRKVRLSPSDLAPIVAATLGIANTSFVELMTAVWSTLHGAVHGGLAIAEGYDDGAAIGFRGNEEELVETLATTALLAQYALMAMAIFAGRTRDETDAAIDPARRALSAFIGRVPVD